MLFLKNVYCKVAFVLKSRYSCYLNKIQAEILIYLYLIINVYLQTRSAKSSSDLDSVHILVAFIDCGVCPHIRIKKSR